MISTPCLHVGDASIILFGEKKMFDKKVPIHILSHSSLASGMQEIHPQIIIV